MLVVWLEIEGLNLHCITYHTDILTARMFLCYVVLISIVLSINTLIVFNLLNFRIHTNYTVDFIVDIKVQYLRVFFYCNLIDYELPSTTC